MRKGDQAEGNTKEFVLLPLYILTKTEIKCTKRVSHRDHLGIAGIKQRLLRESVIYAVVLTSPGTVVVSIEVCSNTRTAIVRFPVLTPEAILTVQEQLQQ